VTRIGSAHVGFAQGKQEAVRVALG